MRLKGSVRRCKHRHHERRDGCQLDVTLFAMDVELIVGTTRQSRRALPRKWKTLPGPKRTRAALLFPSVTIRDMGVRQRSQAAVLAIPFPGAIRKIESVFLLPARGPGEGAFSKRRPQLRGLPASEECQARDSRASAGNRGESACRCRRRSHAKTAASRRSMRRDPVLRGTVSIEPRPPTWCPRSARRTPRNLCRQTWPPRRVATRPSPPHPRRFQPRKPASPRRPG